MRPSPLEGGEDTGWVRAVGGLYWGYRVPVAELAPATGTAVGRVCPATAGPVGLWPAAAGYSDPSHLAGCSELGWGPGQRVYCNIVLF